jgi:hypothetical protein
MADPAQLQQRAEESVERLQEAHETRAARTRRTAERARALEDELHASWSLIARTEAVRAAEERDRAAADADRARTAAERARTQQLERKLVDTNELSSNAMESARITRTAELYQA